MNIGARLETIGKYVPENCVFADIGTDHAYLPVWLVQNNKIKSAVAGDIADGPCLAAKNTVKMYGMSDKIEVRKGSGLKVLSAGEADCIAIAGMGASTIIEILQADLPVAEHATRLVLQPMAGASSLRKWLCSNGWKLVAEELVADGKHLYEIIIAERGESKVYTDAEYEIGPFLMQHRHPLLSQQFAKQISGYRNLVRSMAKSEQARASLRYQNYKLLLQQLEVLADEYHC